jgi:acetyltransferase
VVATAGASHFKSALDVFMKEEQFDSIYVNFVTPPFVDCESVARELAAFSKARVKPIVCNYMTNKKRWESTTKILKDGDIPCFDFAETAAKALSALVRYQRIKSEKKGKVKIFRDVDHELVRKILQNAKVKGTEALSAVEVYSILEAFRIPVAPWRVATSPEEVIPAATEIGYPVVIKADSEKIIHKSDVGGVAVNIRNNDEAKAAAEKMYRKLGHDIKFFVQKYMPGGLELIIGAKSENGVGHLIMFGLGGIFVEIMKDVAFTITPATDSEAEDMMNSLKAVALINGFRGDKGINKDKAAEIIQRVSMLVSDFPEIMELDLNPLIASGENIYSVDARIIL